jgi:hypothetical protein
MNEILKYTIVVLIAAIAAIFITNIPYNSKKNYNCFTIEYENEKTDSLEKDGVYIFKTTTN